MSGAAQAARALNRFQARIAMIDRTDLDMLNGAAIEDALAYIDVTPDIRALADKAKSACRRLAKAYAAPHVSATPRRDLLERARQKLQCNLTRLEAAVRQAPDSWVAAHLEVGVR